MIGKINDAFQSVKNGLELEVKLATAEEKEKLANAKLALADLKMEIANLREENETLKKKSEYILWGGVWWNKADKDRSQPFCSACFAKGREVPLKKTWSGTQKDRTPWTCPENSCGTLYNPWDYKEEAHISTGGRGLFDNPF